MDSKKTPAFMQSGGTRISRRTVTRGVAWSAPIAAVAYAAPAFAASQPVTVTECGVACKHPGTGANDKTYHFTFCFTTNTALVGGIVSLDSMTIANGGEVETHDTVFPQTVSVVPGTPTCVYVDAVGFEDSGNGEGTLAFSYTTAEGTVNDTVTTDINSLPRCGTADGGVNPKDWEHEPNGDPDGPPPTNCVS